MTDQTKAGVQVGAPALSDIKMVRVVLVSVAGGSWAPESQRPDARVAVDALDRIERVVEAAREAARTGHNGIPVAIYNCTAAKMRLREALEALNG